MKELGVFFKSFPRPSQSRLHCCALCNAPSPACFYKQPSRWGLGILTPCLASRYRREPTRTQSEGENVMQGETHSVTPLDH